MAHIEDRWFRSTRDPAGKVTRYKTSLHGTGMRYRVRYIGPDGRERSKSFPDRQKRAAEDFLVSVESDKLRGTYLDPVAGRLTFAEYAGRWLAHQTFNESTREVTERRLRRHILPNLGQLELSAIRPAHVRELDRRLQIAGLSDGYRLVTFANVATILNAAVDDERIAKNPCHARTAKPPTVRTAKALPWTPEQVKAIRSRMPSRYAVAVDLGAGCGMRQGEILALAADDIDFDKGVIQVVRQVKIVGNRLVFAAPKGRKHREVPLPLSVAKRLRDHMDGCAPLPIALPWDVPTGKLVTADLVVYGKTRVALNRHTFNRDTWWPAATGAGITKERRNGMHALRHFYASALLDGGESIKALAAYLGHSDPGFTLRTYTHLMPSSEERTRKAIDRVLGDSTASRPDDGLEIPRDEEIAA